MLSLSLRRLALPALQHRRAYVPFGSHVSDNDPNVIEANKQLTPNRSLFKSAPNWNEALASDSEAFIKADREPEVSIETLCEESVRVLNEDSEGKSAQKGPNRE